MSYLGVMTNGKDKSFAQFEEFNYSLLCSQEEANFLIWGLCMYLVQVDCLCRLTDVSCGTFGKVFVCQDFFYGLSSISLSPSSLSIINIFVFVSLIILFDICFQSFNAYVAAYYSQRSIFFSFNSCILNIEWTVLSSYLLALSIILARISLVFWEDSIEIILDPVMKCHM